MSTATNHAPPRTAPPAGDTPTAGERFRPLARLVLTGALIVLCLVVAYPFLSAITWAVALAVIAWPLHAWLSRHLVRPWLAAGLTSIAVVVTILGPLLFVTVQLAREASAAAESVRQGEGDPSVRDTIVQAPLLRDAVLWAEQFGLDVDREVRKAIAASTADLTGLTQGSIAVTFQALIGLFLLYHLLIGRGDLMRSLRAVLPFDAEEGDRVFRRAAGSVYANLYANTLTSVLDGVLGGLVFWLVGLPSPMLWGTVIFVLSFLPALGSVIIWLPVAGYLLATGQYWQGTVMLGFGAFASIVSGNFLYVHLAGDRMRLHEAFLIISYFGGMVVFGVSGIILGPALYAVTAAVFEIWRQPADGDEALPVVAAAAPPR